MTWFYVNWVLGIHIDDLNDWSSTLNLPHTDFPMRANLAELEPRMLKKWGLMKEDESEK